MIILLEGNGRTLYMVDEIKGAIVDHFQCHFAAKEVRTFSANVNFKNLEDVQGDELIREFLEDEVCMVVWDCDKSKSPGPNRVNFGFVKEFLEDIKEYFFKSNG